MYVHKENFICPKQIMHEKLSYALTVLKAYINSFGICMKLKIVYIENSADPDQRSADQDAHYFPYITQVMLLNQTLKLN